MAMRQTVHVHVADPFMAHHAGGVPAIDHTVVAIPGEHRETTDELLGSLGAVGESGEPGRGSSMPFVHYLLLSHVESLVRTPCPSLQTFLSPSTKYLIWKITLFVCLFLDRFSLHSPGCPGIM